MRNFIEINLYDINLESRCEGIVNIDFINYINAKDYSFKLGDETLRTDEDGVNKILLGMNNEETI
jgi:hypothetical protein